MRIVSSQACLIVALVVVPCLSNLAQENNSPPSGFTALFNGENLDGWHGMNMSPYKLAEMSDEERDAQRAKDMEDVLKHWKVEDGELINDGHGVYLTTDKSYKDYELWIDYKTVPRADSGIYLKATPQVQIWDSTDEAKFRIGADKGSGGLWNNAADAPGKDPLVKADAEFGEWNRFRIVQVGARTSVWLNGKRVVDHALMHNYWNRELPLIAEGPIQLQTHGGEIRWRNIFIRELDSTQANAILAEANREGFNSVFDGMGFKGWAGPVENYQIEDGVLMCKPSKGGTIYTEEEYGDFVARLEFKLPEGGNNGLAIRYPGSGDAAYSAMCELQILDSEHPKYADLDARQYHGSAYGMAPAARGYLRPTGEWNFQEVTVKGSKIKVELNGNLILDTDLSEITEYMGGRPHPGKERTSGHFGFAGHSDPVQFRNIMIKRLND